MFQNHLESDLVLAPQRAVQRHGSASREGREGLDPPCPRHNFALRHMQHLHYAKPLFCFAGWVGLTPPSCDEQPQSVVANRALDKQVGFRNRRHARSFPLGQSASLDKIQRSRWLFLAPWPVTQNHVCFSRGGGRGLAPAWPGRNFALQHK